MSVKFRFLTKKHGMILLFVMLTALMLISLVGAIGVLSKRNLNDVVNQVDSKRAKYAAYAGLSETLARLKTNSNWNAGLTDVQLDSDPNAKYSVEIVNNINGGLGEPTFWSVNAGAWIPVGAAWVRSVGKVGDRVEGAAGMIALAGHYRPKFDFALFARTSMTIEDSIVEPYRSDGIAVANPNVGANVGSNETGTPAIALNNSVINGDAIIGVTGDASLNSAIAAVSSTIRGSRSAADEHVTLQPFIPPFPASPDASRDLNLNGGTYNLGPGDYHDINLSNGAILNLHPQFAAPDPLGRAEVYVIHDLNVSDAGTKIRVPATQDGSLPIIIYVTGNVNISGAIEVGTFMNGAIETPTAPRELQIYMTGNGTNFRVDGANVNLVVAGYDYTATVTNGGQVSGGIIANNIVVTGGTGTSRVRYDTRLAGLLLDGLGDLTLISEDPIPSSEAEAVAGGNPPPPVDPPPPVPAPAPPPAVPVTTVPTVAVVGAPAPAAPAATTAPAPTAPAATTVPAPVTTAPAPVTTVPAPVTTVPAPVTTAPAPVTTTAPAPVTTAPVTTVPSGGGCGGCGGGASCF